jgi:WD40 repeat-containing protein SMU1
MESVKNLNNKKVLLNPTHIIRLIEQYLIENNLSNTLQVLQQESRVKCNILPSIQEFKNEIKNRRWDNVLNTIDNLEINSEILLDLYELIIYDLIENDDRDVAKYFLNNISRSAMKEISNIDSINLQGRLQKLENLVNDTKVKMNEYYLKDRINKDEKLHRLLENLSSEVNEIEFPNRLEHLISEGLKRSFGENLEGLEDYNIISGKSRNEGDRIYHNGIPSVVVHSSYEEALENSDISCNYVKEQTKSLNFGVNSRIEVAKFSLDGEYLATGSIDGFIEIWDPEKFTLKEELSYQLENTGLQMMHSNTVTGINFTKDSKMLCSGDVQGNIKIFKVANGKCLREFPSAHSKAVTCIVFSKDNSQVISGSFDSTIRVHGLKAGTLIAELKGHTSFINDLIINWNEEKLYSASSDGLLKIWNVKHYELINTIKPPSSSCIVEIPINNILQDSRNGNIYICNRSNKIYLMNSKGEILKFFSTGRDKIINYSALSYDGSWLYCVDEENTLYTFSTRDNVIRNFFKIHSDLSKNELIEFGDKKKNDERGNDVIGLLHHPSKETLISYALDGCLNVYN